MNRNELPRIYELRDSLANPSSQNTYFQDFENSIAVQPVKRKHFIHIEAELSGLDVVAWTYLKTEVAHLFERKDPKRGWQAAFDKLNQAKAYNHLGRLGCTDVEFIPESTVSGEKTPDLRGRLGKTRVLCEVKTINPSENEVVAPGKNASHTRSLACRVFQEAGRYITGRRESDGFLLSGHRCPKDRLRHPQFRR